MNTGVTGGHLKAPALSGRDGCGRKAESMAEDGRAIWARLMSLTASER